MNYSFFLARRIGLSEGGRKSSPAVKVAVTAVALAVAVMLASVSIVLGFKREIRDKVIGFNSHISIYAVPAGETDTNLLTLTPTLSGILDDMEFVTDYSLEASIPAILKTKTDFKGVYMRSLGGESIRKFLSENLEEGTIPDYTEGDTEGSHFENRSQPAKTEDGRQNRHLLHFRRCKGTTP